MKKILKVLLLLMVFMLFKNNLYADGLIFNLNCPQLADSGSTISCTVSSSTDSDYSMCAFSARLSITGGTFNSFSSNISMTSNGATGFVFNASDAASCFAGTKIIGTLKVVMPASGSAVVKYDNIQGSNDAGNGMVSSSAVTKTILVKSTVNTLSSITLNNGTLSPAFSSSITNYTALVNANSTTITAIKSDLNSTVSGDGTKSLNYGENKFSIVVTSQSGDKKTYNVTITRPDDRETINTLASLTISNGTLSPAFNANTLNYTATVGATTSKVTINATKTSLKSNFVNGYGSRDVNLEYGSNTVLIKVKSEKEIEKIYKIVINREDNRSSNNNLKTLTISEGDIIFNKNTTDYVISVPFDNDSIIVNATVEDTKSTVTGIGTKTLKEGVNIINIVVTAENTKTKTYKITVTRLSKNESLSSNTKLNSLTIANHDITFDNYVTEYNIKLNEGETKLDFDYEPEDESTIVTIEGNENLTNGSVVVLKVTSTDGTVKEFKLYIASDIVDKEKDNDKSFVSSNGTTYNTLNAVIAIISILVIIGTCITMIILAKKRKKSSIYN